MQSDFGLSKYVHQIALDVLEKNKERCSWFSSYGFVSLLSNSINARVVLEVGVAYGYHAEQLLQAHPNLQYFGIDPYIQGYDPSDSFSTDVTRLFENSGFLPMDVLYRCVAHKLATFNGKASLLRLPSSVAAKFFADNSLDLIYIDGDHRPEAVRLDLISWFPKVRSGGIICGDDFSWPGSPEVITRFFAELDYEVVGYRAGDGPVSKWAVKIR